jgi:hypothetical protein
MSNLYALKPRAVDAPPKMAGVGTRMLKRADVMGALSKLLFYASSNIEVAEGEGRHGDAETQRTRLRTLYTVRDAMLCLPQFVNQQTTEEHRERIEARRAETAETGSVHESRADRPHPTPSTKPQTGG